mmetsp:Transcript_23995/g.53138  ORF Transcript_23995/g.53138 Transcript_23995/m.53138 type:complete len:307 (+) Transcript_23995:829-1749(+)
MLGCFTSNERKGSWFGTEEDFDSGVESLPSTACSPRDLQQDCDVLRGGVRRDRTMQLMRTRRSVRSQPRMPWVEEASEQKAELVRIHRDASHTHTSLESKLAQHNGLCQFGADFADRAPPLELRMLLPELEASIEQLFEHLSASISAIGRLSAPEASRRQTVHKALEQYMQQALQKTWSAFEQQRRQLRDLTAASPLFSPVMSPILRERLAVAIGSPCSTFSTFSTPSPAAPQAQPPLGLRAIEQMPPLRLPSASFPELEEESGCSEAGVAEHAERTDARGCGGNALAHDVSPPFPSVLELVIQAR